MREQIICEFSKMGINAEDLHLVGFVMRNRQSGIIKIPPFFIEEETFAKSTERQIQTRRRLSAWRWSATMLNCSTLRKTTPREAHC